MGRKFVRNSAKIDFGSPPIQHIFLRFILTMEGNCFTKYADDTTPYLLGNNAEKVVSELKAITQKLFTCFALIEMKANLNKTHK